jgi:hypothetical protein
MLPSIISFRKIWLLFALIIFLISLKGCIPMAIGSAIAVGTQTFGDDKYKDYGDIDPYEKYRNRITLVNANREKENLPPLPILSKEEWEKTQKAWKTISEEAKDQKSSTP